MKNKKNIKLIKNNFISKLLNIRTSLYKGCLLSNLIRGQNVLKALSILKFYNNKSSKIILKVLKSAISNAVFKNININNFIINSIYFNKGISFKRLNFRAKGRADTVIKKTCNIYISICDIN